MPRSHMPYRGFLEISLPLIIKCYTHLLLKLQWVEPQKRHRFARISIDFSNSAYFLKFICFSHEGQCASRQTGLPSPVPQSATDLVRVGDLLDAFVDNHANSMLRDIVHDAGPTMVRLVWHTLLYCSIALQQRQTSVLELTHEHQNVSQWVQ